MIWQVRTHAKVNQLPEFKSQLYRVRVVWSPTSQFTPIYKVERMILLNCIVVVRLKYANTLKELRKPGTYEDLNKCWYYSLLYLIQMSSSQRVLLFFMLELEWLKGFLQCPPPNLCAFLKVIGALSHETSAYFSCSAVVLCSTKRYSLLSQSPRSVSITSQLENFYARLRGYQWS